MDNQQKPFPQLAQENLDEDLLDAVTGESIAECLVDFQKRWKVERWFLRFIR